MNAAPADHEPVVGDISRLAKIVGNVIAPTTVLTALLFYFGWMHAYWFFNYFGVNSTLLGLSTTDYVMRSVDGLFVPLMVAAVISLLALWVRVFGRTHVRPGTLGRVDLMAMWVVPIVGAVLLLNGLSRLLWKTTLNTPLTVAPLCLTAGVLLLTWAVHRGRRGTVPGSPRSATVVRSPSARVFEWAVVFVLIGISLFWAATDYSAAVGRGSAREMVAELATEPNVILYSERSLSVNAPGIQELQCANPDAAYRFRYDGLKLILQSNDQYVLIPAAWNPEHGVAIVMPRNDKLRLEFVQSTFSVTAQGATC